MAIEILADKKNSSIYVTALFVMKQPQPLLILNQK